MKILIFNGDKLTISKFFKYGKFSSDINSIFIKDK